MARPIGKWAEEQAAKKAARQRAAGAVPAVNKKPKQSAAKVTVQEPALAVRPWTAPLQVHPERQSAPRSTPRSTPLSEEPLEPRPGETPEEFERRRKLAELLR